VIRGGIALSSHVLRARRAVVMRQLVAEAHPGVIIGAGTVLTATEARDR